jgi:hypothetical protein
MDKLTDFTDTSDVSDAAIEWVSAAVGNDTAADNEGLLTGGLATRSRPSSPPALSSNTALNCLSIRWMRLLMSGCKGLL